MEKNDMYTELRKLSPVVTRNLIKMRGETFKDSIIPAKYKILSALAIVIVTKCEPCIRAYTRLAYDAGVSKGELVEALNVAITESGCPGEQWAMKALEVYLDLQGGGVVEEEVCCKTDVSNV
ncbi:MAG: carboxymuconolactone decarboxylase family protein [Promethearchaeota archaeon]